MPSVNKNTIYQFILFVAFYLYVFSPYLTLGGIKVHGGLLGCFIFVCLGLFHGFQLRINKKFLLVISIFLIYSLYSSLIYQTLSPSHTNKTPGYLITIIFYLVTSYIYYSSRAKSVYFDREKFVVGILLLVPYCTTFNGVVIVLEFFVPEFRSAIQSIQSMENSNINYLERSNRFRGLASGGGASLSLLYGFSIIILYYLFITRKLSTISFVLCGLITFLSCLLIGRTGIAIGGLGFIIISVAAIFNPHVSKTKVSFCVVSSVAFIAVLPAFLALFMNEYTLNRAILFFYDGLEGLSREGTISKLAQMTTYPDTLSAIFLGIGNDSGGFVLGSRSDNGYLKSFTSLGYPIAISLYVFMFTLFFLNIRKSQHSMLFKTLLILWFFIEYKEPFIFKGYTSRFMWFILIVFLVDPKSISEKVISKVRLKNNQSAVAG